MRALVAALCLAAAAPAARAASDPLLTGTEEAAAPRTPGLRYGPLAGLTNTYVYGDEELRNLYQQGRGLAAGVTFEDGAGDKVLPLPLPWRADLVYEERRNTHAYLAGKGDIATHYLVLRPAPVFALGRGFYAAVGPSLAFTVKREVGYALDDETVDKVGTPKPFVLGAAAAVEYRYDVTPRQALVPRIQLDEALTSAREGSQLRYETWSFSVGVLL